MLRVEILGRLVKDVELSFSKEGKAIAKFTIAVQESKDRASFHNVTMFGKVAETFTTYNKKGDMVFIHDATISNSVYEKEGQKIYRSDIIGFGFKFCGNKKSE